MLYRILAGTFAVAVTVALADRYLVDTAAT
jgi:hypothetical protein